MAVIPRRLYDAVEDMLFRRKTLMADAGDKLLTAMERAYAVRSPTLDANGGSHAVRISDKTASGAVAVLDASDGVASANGWIGVFAVLDAAFDGRPEGDIATMMYTDHVTAKDIAVLRGVDRQTIRNYRDTYVVHCALLAVEAGLITSGGRMICAGKD